MKAVGSSREKARPAERAAPPQPPACDETETFFQLSLDLLCIAGTDGYFRRVNPAFEQTLGFSPEELMARPFLDFVHPDDRSATMAEVAKLAEGTPTISFENRYRCRDGAYRWLAWKAEPTPDGTLYAVARDVTERRRVEQSLRENEARARAILETTVDGIITIDERGHIESFNTAAERIFGYAADEVIGQNVKVLMPAPYRDEHDGYMQSYLETGHRKIIGIGREVTGRRKDGTTFPMELAVSEVQLGDRRLFTGVVRDVTRRKRDEVALRLSEQRLRLLYLTTLQPSDSFEAQLEEVLRLTTELLLLDVGLLSRIDDDVYTVVACSSEALASGQTFDLGQTYCSITLAGSDVLAIDHMAVSDHRRHPCYSAFGLESYIGIPIHVNGLRYGTLNFSGAAPKEPGFTEADRDFIRLLGRWVAAVLERQQAEDALRRSEAEARLLSLVASRTDNAVIITDAEGRIEWVNDGFTRITEYGLDEVLGQKPGAFLQGPASDPDVVAHMSGCVRDGLPFHVEIVNYARSGRAYDLDIDAQPVRDEDGRVARFIAIERDVTAQKEAERQREGLLHDLAAANRELNEFAYVVSHDLKAPLRAIGSLAGWIADDYADRLDDDGREQLALLTSRVQRMHNLIEGILQYSRAGRIREEKQTVDLQEMVRSTIDLLAPPPEIDVQIESPLPTLYVEPTRISQVFQNLLGNAIKYMDKPHGEVRVGSAALDGFWQFSVSDNGPGIDEKYFDKIFQLFQTLAPRDDVEGTGVGLSLVKRIVELHGGRVWVTSEVGAGTTFYFTLPQT